MTITPDRLSGTAQAGSAAKAGRTAQSGSTVRASAGTTGQRSGRDHSIDAVRAILLVLVIGLHAMMVGVTVGPNGPVLENALDNQAGFAPVSWFVQMMPMFFIVGGFASISQWRTLRERGTTAPAYVRGRIDRLVRPMIVAVVLVGGVLFAMTMAGVPTDIVATAGFRIGQPLWFLGVYILCSALVPLMVRAHERARIATTLGLLAVVVTVDAARIASGIEAIGFLNLLFVWLLVQQLGFWLADGHIDALHRRTRFSIIAAALATMLVLVSGLYSPDMYVNLNPPTVCLVLLGAAQLMVFSLLRTRIAGLAEKPIARRIIDALGQRGMTIYIWHMPVLIALAAGCLALNAFAGVYLPEPLSVGWWMGRPIWLVIVGLAVIPVVALFARFERGRRMPRAHASASKAASQRAVFVALDTLLGAGGVLTVLIAGFGIVPASVALALLVASLLGTARIAGRVAALSRSFTRHTQPMALPYWGESSLRMTPPRPAGDAGARRIF